MAPSPSTLGRAGNFIFSMAQRYKALMTTPYAVLGDL